jgi:hypothetical protein
VGSWSLVVLVFVVYAVAARRLEHCSVTAPVVLVAAGTVLGAGYLDVLPANVSTESVRLVTELTLALILFADASTVALRQAERDVGLRLPYSASVFPSRPHWAQSQPGSCSRQLRGPRLRSSARSSHRPTPRSVSRS